MFLLAPTVPSRPEPEEDGPDLVGRSGVGSSGRIGRLRCVTSSTIPTVKWRFGLVAASSSKTALTIAGVNSLDDRP